MLCFALVCRNFRIIGIQTKLGQDRFCGLEGRKCRFLVFGEDQEVVDVSDRDDSAVVHLHVKVVEEQSRAMAYAYGLGYVVRDGHSTSPIAGTSSAAAAAVGIASFTAEVGG